MRGVVAIVLADAPPNRILQRSLGESADAGPIGDAAQLDDRCLDRHRRSLSLLYECAHGFAEGISFARTGRVGAPAQSVERTPEIVRGVAQALTLPRIAIVPYSGCQTISLSGIDTPLGKV